MQVTGEVVTVNRKHHWFRVKFRLPGVPYALFECFALPPDPDEDPPRYGHGHGMKIAAGSHRGDYRYDIKK